METIHAYHVLLTSISLAANVLMGSTILAINARNRLNLVYAFFSFSVAYWAALKLGQAFAASEVTAALHYRISGPGWCTLPATCLFVVFAFTKHRLTSGNKLTLALLYAASAVFAALLWVRGFMLEGMVMEAWGFAHVPGPVYRLLFQPYLILTFGYGVFVLAKYAKRSQVKDERARATILIAAILVPVVGGAITNMILPSLDIHVLELALPLTTVNVGLIAIAIVKYKIFTFTVEYAAGTIIDTMGDALIVVDPGGRIMLTNEAARGLLRFGEEEMEGRDLDTITRKDVSARSLSGEINLRGTVHREDVFFDKTGKAIAVSLSISQLKGKKGEASGLVLVAKDIRELKRLMHEIEEARKELERLAITDPLTEIYNRRYLMLKLKEEFLRSRRYQVPFSVAIIDLDRFKEVNDGFGHEEGDRVLMAIAQSIKSTLRLTDTVARYGGDEFVVLLPETAREAAESAAERIREGVGSADIPKRYRFVTVSIGVSTFDPSAPDVSEDELLRKADAAMYHAKKMGRDRMVHADEMGSLPPAAGKGS